MGRWRCVVEGLCGRRVNIKDDHPLVLEMTLMIRVLSHEKTTHAKVLKRLILATVGVTWPPEPDVYVLL
jgi:hypothetical protein